MLGRGHSKEKKQTTAKVCNIKTCTFYLIGNDKKVSKRK